MVFKLIYHAGIPGRAEFARLFLEATATPYIDSALDVAYLKKGFPGCPENPTPLAPPILVHGDVVISQTPNILLYLAAHLPSIDLSAPVDAEPDAKKVKATPLTLQDASVYHNNELALTCLDLVNEVHDTHHPLDITDFYEAQKDAAVVRSRVFRDLRAPKFLGHFEGNIAKSSGHFLTQDGPTYADLALFHVYDGLLFAFPKLMASLGPKYPLTSRLYEEIKAAPRIAAYLKSDRRQPYSHGIFRYYPELDLPEA